MILILIYIKWKVIYKSEYYIDNMNSMKMMPDQRLKPITILIFVMKMIFMKDLNRNFTKIILLNMIIQFIALMKKHLFYMEAQIVNLKN